MRLSNMRLRQKSEMTKIKMISLTTKIQSVYEDKDRRKDHGALDKSFKLRSHAH